MAVGGKLALAVLLGLCSAAGAASACQSRNAPVLDDSFKMADPGWGQPDNVAAFTANGLVLTPPVSGSGWRWNSNHSMARADLCVQVMNPARLPSPADQETVGDVGVWFWSADSQNFYTATISLDGSTSITRLVHGNWRTVIAPVPSPAVKTAPGAVNEIEIVTNGNTASFYVNGTKIEDFQGQAPANGGPPGIYGESGPTGTAWTFQRVRVF
jgi:hypothetical protein